MDKFGVQLQLEKIAEARHDWGFAQSEFNKVVAKMMRRLLHEAAANKMSVEQIARFSGLTAKRVRTMMREIDLDPRMGKTVLSDKAATVLAQNADTLGVEPHEIDLMSPLQYLPIGREISDALQSEAVRGVKELPVEDPPILCTVPGCNCDIEYRAARA